MSKKAKVGVIGTGFWGKNHARVLSELDNADLIAVCDTDSDRAMAMGKKYDIDWHSQSEDLLKNDDVEAVCICTPTITHAEIGHRSATICHLSMIAILLGRKLRWDPAAERFINDNEANRMLHQSMRSPWTL